MTIRASASVWSYPNVVGSFVVTANSSGTKTNNVYNYDPYGQPLVNGSMPDNSARLSDYAWLGQYQRPYDHAANMLAMIEMGQRAYLPQIGRFLSIDPIEGGSANDYDYANGDPINQKDLDGRSPESDLARLIQKQARKRTARSAFNFVFTAFFPYYSGSAAFLGSRLQNLAQGLRLRRDLVNAFIEGADGGLNELRIKYLVARVMYEAGRVLVKDSEKKQYDLMCDRCFGGLGVNRC